MQARSVLKAVSIVFMVFAILDILISIIAALTPINLSVFIGVDISTFPGGLTLFLIIGICIDALFFMIGFMGLKRCSDPAKANFFIVSGAILSAVTLLSLTIGFSISDIILLALSALFLVFGIIHKKQKPAE